MSLATTQRTAKSIYDKLSATIDLAPVKGYAVSRREYEADEVDEAFDEYLKFIAVVASSGRMMPITPQLDKAWHCHLLYNESYGDMCAALGADIFHEPKAIKPQDAPDADWEYTEYRGAFGEPPSRYWQDLRGESEGVCCNRVIAIYR